MNETILSYPYCTVQISEILNCSMDNGVIGLMDPAHGPFVHDNFWWRRRKLKEKSRIYEPILNGFRVKTINEHNTGPYRLLGPGPTITMIDFMLPSYRIEIIQSGKWWVSTVTMITEISEQKCKLDFIIAWNCLLWLPFVRSIVRVCACRFLNQDKRVIEQQAIGLKYEPRMMFVTDADKPALWYFKLKEAHRNGSGIHPLKGPTILRWRS